MLKRAPRAGEAGEKGTALAGCPRVGRVMAVGEHLRCPYCFGGRADVARGDRRLFCDFLEGTDPVCFGFPGTDERRMRS